MNQTNRRTSRRIERAEARPMASTFSEEDFPSLRRISRPPHPEAPQNGPSSDESPRLRTPTFRNPDRRRSGHRPRTRPPRHPGLARERGSLEIAEAADRASGERAKDPRTNRRAQPDTRPVSLDFPGSIPYPATVTAPPVSGRAASTIGRRFPEPARWTPGRRSTASPRPAPLHPLPPPSCPPPPAIRPASASSPTGHAPDPLAPRRISSAAPARPAARAPATGATAKPPGAYQVGALNPIPATRRLTSLARFLTLQS
jgi:hypothetical protein